MKIIYIVLAFLAVITPAGAQNIYPDIKIQDRPTEQQKEEEKLSQTPYFILVDKAEKAIGEEKYDDAITALIEAMATEPENPLNIALRSNLGMLYYYNEEDSLALVTLDDVCRRSPGLVSGHENRARVLIGLGRDVEAYDEYGKVIEIDSVNTTARFYHGMMALYGGDRLTAERDFDVLERVIPLARMTYLAKGTLYSMTGRDHEAISYLRKLIEVEPYAEYYARLVGCLIAVENFTEASDYIARGLERYPQDPELYYYRAVLNKKRYLSDEARRDADLAIKYGADKSRVESLFAK